MKMFVSKVSGMNGAKRTTRDAIENGKETKEDINDLVDDILMVLPFPVIAFIVLDYYQIHNFACGFIVTMLHTFLVFWICCRYFGRNK